MKRKKKFSNKYYFSLTTDLPKEKKLTSIKSSTNWYHGEYRNFPAPGNRYHKSITVKSTRREIVRVLFFSSFYSSVNFVTKMLFYQRDRYLR